MDLREIVRDDGRWMELAQGPIKCSALVLSVLLPNS